MCMVMNSSILWYLQDFSILLYKAEHHLRNIYVRWGLCCDESIWLLLAVAMNYYPVFSGSRQDINESVNLENELQS